MIRDFSIKPSPAAPTGDCFGFDAIYMRDELTPAVPGQMIAVDSEEVKEFRLLYRLMCYYLKTQEFTLSSGLGDEDRPDLANALNGELLGWAGIALPA